MITTINHQGEKCAAIVFKGFRESDLEEFAPALINIFALVFSRDENMEYVDSITMYEILELYKAVTEKEGGKL